MPIVAVLIGWFGGALQDTYIVNQFRRLIQCCSGFLLSRLQAIRWAFFTVTCISTSFKFINQNRIPDQNSSQDRTHRVAPPMPPLPQANLSMGLGVACISMFRSQGRLTRSMSGMYR